MANTQPYSYSFEIETIIKQFVSLLNGAIIKRYDVDEESDERTLRSTIYPSYVCGPKQRIIYDLVNKAKNYTLPCIIISLTGISMDTARLTAKYTIRDRVVNQKLLSYKFPTPISLSFDVTIFAKYITDLYQIYGKFCTEFQNNLVFSWYVPHDKNVEKEQWEELTSKVEWDGNVSFDIKQEKRESDEDKFIAKTTFKVDGWIFPDLLAYNGNIIKDIGTTNYVPDYVNEAIGEISSYKPFMKDIIKDKNLPSYNNPREWNNAHPRITNIFYTVERNNKLIYFLLDQKRVRPINANSNPKLTFDGYNFKYADILFVPKDKNSLITNLPLITHDYSKQNIFAERNKNEEKHSIIEGYKMNVTEQSENKVIIDFSDINYQGEFDIVIADDIDYDTLSDSLGTTITFNS